MRPASTTKNFEKRVVRKFLKQKLKRCFHVEHTSGCSVEQKTSSGKSIAPKAKRHSGMSKKSEASLNDVTVLALNRTVLLMCMRTRHTMRNSQFGKESIEVAIVTPPQSD
jgi:hypothetical protein